MSMYWLISVDGMHAVDLAKWIENHPDSTFAKAGKNRHHIPERLHHRASDSYPGMIAQVTGATPKTGGLF